MAPNRVNVSFLACLTAVMDYAEEQTSVAAPSGTFHPRSSRLRSPVRFIRSPESLLCRMDINSVVSFP